MKKLLLLSLLLVSCAFEKNWSFQERYILTTFNFYVREDTTTLKDFEIPCDYAEINLSSENDVLTKGCLIFSEEQIGGSKTYYSVNGFGKCTDYLNLDTCEETIFDGEYKILQASDGKQLLQFALFEDQYLSFVDNYIWDFSKDKKIISLQRGDYFSGGFYIEFTRTR